MDEVSKAEKELQDFLEKNPHMRKDQEKLDLLLKNTPEDKRLEVLGILTSAKLLELQEQLIKLNEILVSTVA